METSKDIIIAVDGYSSTGKSTIAKKLARKLGYVYVDTGAMYRAVALYAMKNGYIDKDHFEKEDLIADLNKINLQFHYNSKLGFSEIYLNDKNVEQEIRTIEVSNMVSKVATVSEFREKLVEQQHKMGLNKGIVMDGRDIATVVFPNAELKIFMTATAEERAQRRFKEMTDNGEKVSYNSVLENVNSRDLLDTTRKDSPLVRAKDAIEIDNTELNADQTFDKIYQYVQEKLGDV